MSTEKWRKYKGKYSVSNIGNIRNDETNIILKPKVKTNDKRQQPRCQINLSFQGKQKTFLIHRLVAEVWIPNPHNKPQINHKDGNTLNNKVDNLEWCTQSENIIHAYKHGLMSQVHKRRG